MPLATVSNDQVSSHLPTIPARLHADSIIGDARINDYGRRTASNTPRKPPPRNDEPVWLLNSSNKDVSSPSHAHSQFPTKSGTLSNRAMGGFNMRTGQDWNDWDIPFLGHPSAYVSGNSST